MEEIWQSKYLYQENLHVHASRGHTNLGSLFTVGAVEPKPCHIYICMYVYICSDIVVSLCFSIIYIYTYRQIVRHISLYNPIISQSFRSEAARQNFTKGQSSRPASPFGLSFSRPKSVIQKNKSFLVLSINT